MGEFFLKIECKIGPNNLYYFRSYCIIVLFCCLKGNAQVFCKFRFQGDWVLSMKYAERLCNESKWSKATYMYQKACFLMMCDEQTDETKKHIDYLLG